MNLSGKLNDKRKEEGLQALKDRRSRNLPEHLQAKPNQCSDVKARLPFRIYDERYPHGIVRVITNRRHTD